MDSLGRYYTKDVFSDLLIRNLENDNPKTVLELGVGGGSLIKAAYNRWKMAEFIATDIDKKSINKISTDLPFIKIYQANGLKVNIEKNIFLNNSTIDIAICNPPYLIIKEKKKFEKLFVEANLQECINLSRVTSDIVFLSQNLKFLKKNGELGIILPDSILTGKEFQNLRIGILKNHKIKALIELPDKIFSKTEAKTHIMFLEKGGDNSSKIPLYISGRDGICLDQIDISADSLIERMDYSFHKNNIQIHKNKSLNRLKDFSHTIIRGNKTNLDLKASKIKYLHSTSFKHGDKIAFDKYVKRSSLKYSIAEPGDIIITRVGRGCVGKSALVTKGQIPISDCLYVIKAEKKVIKGLWNFINSQEGKPWFEANSHGVCSKVLSRSDILNLPVDISNFNK